MRWRTAVLLLLVVAVCAAAVPMFFPSLIWRTPSVPAGTPPPDAKRGAYLAAIGGCASCHTAKGGAALAGGVELGSPFGTFVGPNITSHATAGIGRWTEADFLRAMRDGLSPSGRHYYPAFPYTSYTRMTVGDLRDLWAYLRTVPPSANAPAGHDLGFPWNFRPGIGLWKLVWFSPGAYEPVRKQTAVWNRGAYLVDGPLHCAECHTKRNFAGALDRSHWMAGTRSGPDGKPVPNITPSSSGIGKWSARDLSFFLQSGMLPSGDATGGEMAKVIEHTAKLSETDLAAVVAYLRSLPPAAGPSPAR